MAPCGITTISDGLRRSPAPELLTGRIKEFSTEVESFTAKDGFSADVVRAILQDRGGNIWVGSNYGVDRLPQNEPGTGHAPLPALECCFGSRK